MMSAERVFAGRALIAFARPNAIGQWRIGVTVSRRLRGAVQRNRLRRRLREAARSSLLSPGRLQDGNVPQGYDVILIGRPAAAELPLSVLKEETARVGGRLRVMAS